MTTLAISGKVLTQFWIQGAFTVTNKILLDPHDRDVKKKKSYYAAVVYIRLRT